MKSLGTGYAYKIYIIWFLICFDDMKKHNNIQV